MTITISSREGLSFDQQSFGSVSNKNEKSTNNPHKITTATQSTLRQSTDGWKIIHTTNGRVRIRVTDGTNDSTLEELTKYLKKEYVGTEVYFSQATGSAIVKFNEKKFSLTQMLGVLEKVGIQQQALSEQTEKTDPFAAWKSPAFWKEQTISLIPLAMGLAVTGRLGISGLAAIPVYMITADTTRLVMGRLQSPKKVEINSQSSLKKVEKKSAVKDFATEPAKIVYSVVHSIPGRIRFHIPRLAQDSAYGRRLERLLKIDPHVTNVRVNCDAASVTITFSSNEIPLSHWARLMELATQTIAPISTNTTELQTDTVIASPWTQLKAPALCQLLDMMANLSLESFP